jgi:hypothetical protein
MAYRSKVDRYLPWSLIAPRTVKSKEDALVRPEFGRYTVKRLSGGCILYELQRFLPDPRSTDEGRFG